MELLEETSDAVGLIGAKSFLTAGWKGAAFLDVIGKLEFPVDDGIVTSA